MSFGAGFFGGLADGMEDKRVYIREKVEQRSAELRRMGLERQQQVGEARQAYETAFSRLSRMEGVDQTRIMSALESDPDAVVDIYRRVEQNPDINGEVINNFFNVYDNAPQSGSITEALDLILPISQRVTQATNDPAQRETMTFAAMLGLDAEAALDDQVYNSEIVGNMTGNDILAMGTNVRARGVGEGRQLDYSIFSDDSLYPDDNDLSISERTTINREMSNRYGGMIIRDIEGLQQQRDALVEDESLTQEERNAQDTVLRERQGALQAIINAYPEGGGGLIDEAQRLYGTDPAMQVLEDMGVASTRWFGEPVESEEEQPMLPGIDDQEVETTTLPDEEAPEVLDNVPEMSAPEDEEDIGVRDTVDAEGTVFITPEQAESPEFSDVFLREFFRDNINEDSVRVGVRDENGDIVGSKIFRRDELEFEETEGDPNSELILQSYDVEAIPRIEQEVREKLLQDEYATIPVRVRFPDGDQIINISKSNIDQLPLIIQDMLGEGN